MNVASIHPTASNVRLVFASSTDSGGAFNQTPGGHRHSTGPAGAWHYPPGQ
jgi:hypothetical protein